MIYDILASLYDRVNGEVPYGEWADSVLRRYEELRGRRPSLGLDLGCGTGAMTYALAGRGVDMIGVDASAEMLNIAREKSGKIKTSEPVLWLMQDMTAFELYGTVDLAVSTLDCFNHLSEEELRKTLDLLRNYIEPGGLLFFDLNTLYKFRETYGDNTYTFEDDGIFAVWENHYGERSKKCDFYITVFRENDDGTYTRADDVQRETFYSEKKIRTLLSESGFACVGAYADYDGTPFSDTSEKMFVIARRKNENE